MKESAYPFACLFAGSLVAMVSVTAGTSMEMQIAGLGFGGGIVSSGGTAFKNKNDKYLDGDITLVANEVIAQLISQGVLSPRDDG